MNGTKNRDKRYDQGVRYLEVTIGNNVGMAMFRKMTPMCFTDNEPRMSSDTTQLILDFRETVIIVTPGFPGHTRNSSILLC